MVNTIQLASPLQHDSIVDGPGIRIVVWTQGCIHQCKNCHNPHTWEKEAGTTYQIDKLVQEIKDAQLQTGITFSGGEPFLQADALLPLAKAAKDKGYNIWAYTGFYFEDLQENNSAKELLSYIHVLVDGKFIDDQKDYRLTFKGSRNQRIIDVQASSKQQNIVISNYDDQNTNLG